MYVNENKICENTMGRPKFKVLAPSRREVPKQIRSLAVRSESHSDLMFDLQMLRGKVYQEYAGIAATLLPDGRHWHALDAQSWHIVAQNADGQVIGCARYRSIQSFEQLICSKAAVALCPVTGPIFRSTFADQINESRRRGIHFGEASAWAMSEEARCSTTAVNIALMSFALAEWVGGGLGLTTASTRHHASSILRRLGGSPLAGFAPYYEPMFDCSIELLQFDVNNLHPRYMPKLNEIRAQLQTTPVICPQEVREDNAYAESLTIPKYVPVGQQHSVSSAYVQ